MRLLKNNSGMAVLLTLMIISILVVVVLQFNASMRSDLYASVNLRDGVKLNYTAKSAFNLAREVLYADAQENSFDTLDETWAKLPTYSDYAAILLEQERVKLAIADHSGKIQINALVYAEDETRRQEQYDLLTRFFLVEEFDLSAEEVEEIIAAIQDWLDDNNEESGFGGAENSYYQTLEKPYACKNGPMEFIEELLLIKGISKKLFYGSKEQPGINMYLTPYGMDGKVNINTADKMVLLALSEEISPELAEDMVAYRENGENDLSDINWYKDVPAFPGDIELNSNSISVSSSYFEVTVDAYHHSMRKTISGVLQREGKDILQVVSWKIE